MLTINYITVECEIIYQAMDTREYTEFFEDHKFKDDIDENNPHSKMVKCLYDMLLSMIAVAPL